MKYRLARVLRVTGARLILVAFSTRVMGRDNVPPGGAVLSGNHVSNADPILLWCFSPRPCHFMAKSELFENRFLGWLLRHLWAFKVNRHEADRRAIETATQLLRDGELVGIFPEGTRVEEPQAGLGEAHGGAAFIALRADVPIVPIGIVGTGNVLRRGQKLPRLRRVTASIGAPVYPSEIPEGSRKERVEAMTALVMARIAEEIERAREVHR